jgi:hypothetical protein
VYVAYQLQKIGVFLTKDGFVAVLKKLPMTSVSAVEGYGMPSQEPSHHRGNGIDAGFQAKVEMVGKQCPCIAYGGGFQQNTPKSLQKTFSVTIILEYVPALYASHNDVMKSVWCVDASLSWHGTSLA